MARVIITGGTGFVGQLLARSILKRGQLAHAAAAGVERLVPVREVLLADVVQPKAMLFEELSQSPVQVVTGDLSDDGYCKALFAGNDGGPLSVFHLGAVMSGQGEADFDLCMGVNFRGTLQMLEAARHCGAPRPRFIYASAGATFGSGAPTDYVTKDDEISDATRATPHTTYGMTKAVGELLLSDYSRRHFVDGRGLRLPSVVVRAGAPNAATTSCFSAVIREPLAGVDVSSPVAADVAHAVTGHRTAVDCLLRMHEVPSEAADAVLGFDRTVFVPSVSVTQAALEDAVRKVVAADSHKRLGRVTYDVADRTISDAVGSFPARIACDRAKALGLLSDPASLQPEALVRAYCDDFPQALHPALRLTPTPQEPAVGQEGGASAHAPASAVVDAALRRTQAAAAGRGMSVALVTGGGTGIGRAVALRLAEGGWQADGSDVALVLTGRRLELLQETASAIREAHGERVSTLVWPCDLCDEPGVDGLFGAISSAYGRLDVLFNNAGANVPPTTVNEMSMEAWRQVVGINLDAAFQVARNAFVMMKEQSPQGGARRVCLALPGLAHQSWPVHLPVPLPPARRAHPTAALHASPLWPWLAGAPLLTAPSVPPAPPLLWQAGSSTTAASQRQRHGRARSRTRRANTPSAASPSRSRWTAAPSTSPAARSTTATSSQPSRPVWRWACRRRTGRSSPSRACRRPTRRTRCTIWRACRFRRTCCR